jgi:hypothetical protein
MLDHSWGAFQGGSGRGQGRVRLFQTRGARKLSRPSWPLLLAMVAFTIGGLYLLVAA